MRGLPPPLKADEEVTLFRRVRGGDRLARAEAIARNLRLVIVIARDLKNIAPAHYQDMEGEGMVGLIHAVDKFDPDRGVRFSTYATHWIRALIMKFLVDNARIVRVGHTRAERGIFWNQKTNAKELAVKFRTTEEKAQATLDRLGVSEMTIDLGPRTLGDTLRGGDQPDHAYERAAAKAMRSAVCTSYALTLDDRDRDLWRRRLATDDPITMDDFGRRHGITRQRVQQLELRVLRKFAKFVRNRVEADDVLGEAA